MNWISDLFYSGCCIGSALLLFQNSEHAKQLRRVQELQDGECVSLKRKYLIFKVHLYNKHTVFSRSSNSFTNALHFVVIDSSISSNPLLYNHSQDLQYKCTCLPDNHFSGFYQFFFWFLLVFFLFPFGIPIYIFLFPMTLIYFLTLTPNRLKRKTKANLEN